MGGFARGALVAVAAVAGLAFVGGMVSGRAEPEQRDVAAAAPPVRPACDVSHIALKDVDGGFVDECSTRACPSFKGTGTLTNGCTTPIGVRLKITAFDAQGRAIQTRELWPASTRNIAPGDYAFSMDTWLEPDDRIERFAVEPAEVKAWR